MSILCLAQLMACAHVPTSTYPQAKPERAVPAAGDVSAAQVNALADEWLAHLRATNAHVRMLSRIQVTELDDLSWQAARNESAFSRQMLTRLAAIELTALPHEQWLLARMLRHTFANGAAAERKYWFQFYVMPYMGGFRILGTNRVFAAQLLQTQEQRDNYLHLLDEYGRMLDQIAAKTRAQAERDLRVPQPAISGVLAFLQGMQASVGETLTVREERLEKISAAERICFNDEVARRVAARVLPAYERIIAIFDAAYRSAAPQEVGLGRYPGGKEQYLQGITEETGLKLAPQVIHDMGLKWIAELDSEMQTVRDELGFKGNREEFHEMLRSDPLFFAKTPAEVEQRYRTHLARIEPHIAEYFSTLPAAPYGVKRIGPAAESGMTYGHYQEPTPADPVGYYAYNGSGLDQRSLVTSAHMIYHELVPGHHFHVALQTENENVHPVRAFLFYGAFNEGWGEYGASLAGEMGGYADPYDRYGHLLTQSIVAVRLVVDTGMNYFDWPLERARDYMRAHTFEADIQIASDSLRYSTDLYGQALGYGLGYQKIWELRRRAQATLGERFDIRAFHAAVVGSGAMPLDVLDEHINWFIAQSRAASPAKEHSR